MSAGVDWAALERAAIAARDRAYAPYSRYHVGAAVLADDGVIYAGCNVENASYGLTLCAERNAVGAMIAHGARRVVGVVVATAGPRPGAPCGMCRQVIAEFCDDAPVRLIAVDPGGEAGARHDTSAAALLPERFGAELLPPAEAR